MPPGTPAPAVKWTGAPRYNFTGGNNDPDGVPVDGLLAAAQAVIAREGRSLATYGLNSGPQGYRPLRDFLAAKLKRDAGMNCTRRRHSHRVGLAAGARPGACRAADAR